MARRKVQITRPRRWADPGEPLTMRERRILMWLALGESMPKLARRLRLSLHGIEWHVRQIKRKLGAKNVAHAVFKATTAGILMRVSPRRRADQGAAVDVQVADNIQRVVASFVIDPDMPEDKRRWRKAIYRHWTRLIRA